MANTNKKLKLKYGIKNKLIIFIYYLKLLLILSYFVNHI